MACVGLAANFELCFTNTSHSMEQSSAHLQLSSMHAACITLYFILVKVFVQLINSLVTSVRAR